MRHGGGAATGAAETAAEAAATAGCFDSLWVMVRARIRAPAPARAARILPPRCRPGRTPRARPPSALAKHMHTLPTDSMIGLFGFKLEFKLSNVQTRRS